MVPKFKAVKYTSADIVKIISGGVVLWQQKLENIALGKKVRTTLTSYGYGPEYVVDGIKDDDTKQWISASNSRPARLIIELGAVYRITEIRIYSGAQNGTTGFIPYVSINTENSVESTIVEDGDVNQYESIYMIKQPCETDKIHFNFRAGFNRIYEIEIYGEYLREK